MTATINTAVRDAQRVAGGWVAVDSVRHTSDGLALSLGVRRGRRGPRVGLWEVRCTGVREICISDLDGGGIALYPPTHPAARQFTAPVTRLTYLPGQEFFKALGALAAAHLAAVDDWVPVERFLPLAPGSGKKLALRAPDFLARAYARALRKAGFRVQLSTPAAGRRGRTHPRVLHFGNSFVVADRFEVRDGLANNALQLTKPAQAMELRS